MLVCRGNKYLILFELFVPLKSNYNNYFLAFSNVGLLIRKALSVKHPVTNDQTTTKHLQFKSVY